MIAILLVTDNIQNTRDWKQIAQEPGILGKKEEDVVNFKISDPTIFTQSKSYGKKYNIRIEIIIIHRGELTNLNDAFKCREGMESMLIEFPFQHSSVMNRSKFNFTHFLWYIYNYFCVTDSDSFPLKLRGILRICLTHYLN